MRKTSDIYLELVVTLTLKADVERYKRVVQKAGVKPG
jgi:hypothetical protein